MSNWSMDPDIKGRWVKALCSGEYKQGVEQLRHADEHGERYCCLGVLGELWLKETGGDWGKGAIRNEDDVLPAVIDEWAGFPSWIDLGDELADPQEHLAKINDDGWLFEAIANAIEELL